MSMIEGVGDEVTVGVSVFLVLCLMLLAWLSTHTRDIPLVNVIVVELSQRRRRARNNGLQPSPSTPAPAQGQSTTTTSPLTSTTVTASTSTAATGVTAGAAVPEESTRQSGDGKNETETASGGDSEEGAISETERKMDLNVDNGIQDGHDKNEGLDSVNNETKELDPERAVNDVTAGSNNNAQTSDSGGSEQTDAGCSSSAQSGADGKTASSDVVEQPTPSTDLDQKAAESLQSQASSHSQSPATEEAVSQLDPSEDLRRKRLEYFSGERREESRLSATSVGAQSEKLCPESGLGKSNENSLCSADGAAKASDSSPMPCETSNISVAEGSSLQASKVSSSQPPNVAEDSSEGRLGTGSDSAKAVSDASVTATSSHESANSTPANSSPAPTTGEPVSSACDSIAASVSSSVSLPDSGSEDSRTDTAPASSGSGGGLRQRMGALAENSMEGVGASVQQIRVRLKYLNDTQRLVYTDPQETVGNFRRLHFSSELEDNQIVRFIFNGQEIRNDLSTLRAYNINDNSVVHCLISQSRQNEPGPSSAGALGDEGEGQMGVLLLPLCGLILGVLWYARLHYRQYFTATTTLAMGGLTFLYLLMLCSSLLHRVRARAPPQPPHAHAD